jgi:hypothetical protein
MICKSRLIGKVFAGAMPSRRVPIRDTSLSELRPRRPFGFPAHSRHRSTPDIGIIEQLAAQPLGHRLQIHVP